MQIENGRFYFISNEFIEKYKTIYEKKKQKIHREPLNFVFGIVKDENAVFLIQNMFPTVKKYIEEKYQVKNNDVTFFNAFTKRNYRKG